MLFFYKFHLVTKLIMPYAVWVSAPMIRIMLHFQITLKFTVINSFPYKKLTSTWRTKPNRKNSKVLTDYLQRKPVEPFNTNRNKLVRSGSVSSANPATSSVLRPSTSVYTHSDNAANIASNSPESQSVSSSSSSGGILSPPPEQPLEKLIFA